MNNCMVFKKNAISGYINRTAPYKTCKMHTALASIKIVHLVQLQDKVSNKTGSNWKKSRKRRGKKKKRSNRSNRLEA